MSVLCGDEFGPYLSSAQKSSTEKISLKLLFFGDVMFGRQLFGERKHYFMAHPFKHVLPNFRKVDAIFFNLETVLVPDDTDPIPEWAREDKTFNYQARNTQLRNLRDSEGFKTKPMFASMINNHTLDYGVAGMELTIKALEKLHIHTTTTEEPITVRVRDTLISFFSATDHPKEWKNDIWVVNTKQPDPRFILPASVEKNIRQLKSEGNFIVFSVHWGPNRMDDVPIDLRDPEDNLPFYLKRFGHHLIDLGVDIVFGHSAHHIPQPVAIEEYANGTIIYGLGDFINDYEVDKVRKSNHVLMCVYDTGKRTYDTIEVTRNFEVRGSSIPSPDK